MSALPSLAAKSYSLPIATALSLPLASQNNRPSQLQNKPLTSAPSFASDVVSLSKAGMDWSSQKNLMADRVNGLSSAAVDMAQNFLTQFAQSVLGDAANGMVVSFDSANVSANSHFQGEVQHSENPSGVTGLSAFRLEDIASFSGKGVITTSDGRRFNFEVEVQYKAIAESTTTSQSSRASNAMPLQIHTQEPVPPAPKQDKNNRNIDADFPGTVNDLLHMMGHKNNMSMSFDLPPMHQGDGKVRQGQLMLRLLDMIENPKTVNSKLAKAYGVPEISPAPVTHLVPTTVSSISSDAVQA